MEVKELSPNTSDLPCPTKRKREKKTIEKVELFGMKGINTEESACTGAVKGKLNEEQVRVQMMLK